MRLFVAVDLDENVRRAAARVTRALRERLERAETYGVSWVGADNLHLTLRFLGEVGETVVPDVQAALSPPFAVAPFEVALGNVGTFPLAGSVRVIWLGVIAGGDALARLHDEVAARLVRFPFEKDDRAYRAHLTIGRFRVPQPARVRDTVSASDPGTIGHCTVKHVTLYRSQLSPKGAIYTPLVRAPLAGTST